MDRIKTSLAAAIAALALVAGGTALSGQEQLPGARKPVGDPGRGDEPGASSVRAAPLRTGEEVYRGVCQACHMADGRGGQGAGVIPSLANDPRLAGASYPITLVAKGRGAMPWFNDTLTPAQVAAVVGYVRTHFGNAYPAPVTAADVEKVGGRFYTHSRDAH